MNATLLAWSIAAAKAALISCALANPVQAGEAIQKKTLFGELHMHTAWSFDVFIFKVRVNPDDAYRFAKGEPLKHPSGKAYQLSRPLDFMAVTDHAEYNVPARLTAFQLNQPSATICFETSSALCVY